MHSLHRRRRSGLGESEKDLNRLASGYYIKCHNSYVNKSAASGPVSRDQVVLGFRLTVE